MRVAIAKDDNRVSGHFGHCEGFQVYEVNGQEIMGSTFLQNPGHKPGFLPKFLSENDIHVIIAGGMGARAQQLFSAESIQVVVGAQGQIEDAIRGFVDGKLVSTNSVCKEHEHAGDCGGH
ncbi:dinitrogenase iron-molybdenum cofactor [Acidaminobacter sp. JC074]|uniref:NifB/NifX family molybdenum-iron cluster-binding protein n=1 Tax=Acidaminobacter sp. JC074 TaxID=2530199 RepID=UPI001F0D6F68|nr:NifB/NifX family molybdenum-iron cluster-binding protein [Acidaminobacter sp. JC074]MCH4889354.1 dinitrogenase iron-molybdenum cofactor [Acidaminobacter sp. JC074]